jgi:catechol 2,3-dioxygenase-like lactoylglutathione lyase family enzyme
MLIDGMSAILLVSADAKRLADFYRNVLAMPIEDEVHEGVPLHYACDLGSVHFAIHPADGWPGRVVSDAQSPVIALRTTDADAAAGRLAEAGIDHTGPSDHGFARVVSFRDPDGHHVELLESVEP